MCVVCCSLDVPAGVTQEEGHTRFLMHLLSAVRAFCRVDNYKLKSKLKCAMACKYRL